jgi:hypothetical protein
MKQSLWCMTALCICFPCFAQYYFYDAHHLEPEWRWESGITMGWMNCLTDLGGRKGNGKKFIKDINTKNGRPCAGLFMKATYRDVIGLRLECNIGQITASDSILKNDQSEAASRYKRNLHFRSAILEASLIAEFHPLSLNNSAVHTFSPYILLGVGAFHFQPQACLEGRWINLKPLHTEGEGFPEYSSTKEYKLSQVNIPIGCGLKYDASALMNLNLEMMYRILRTDYLDDVSTNYIDPRVFYKHLSPSQARLAEILSDRTNELDITHHTQEGAMRGNPKNNDAYFSVSLKVSFVLNRKHY